MDDYFALIMAGGGGTRLWPMSRRARPKQILPLVGDKTMYEVALERLAPLFSPERILVVTTAAMAPTLRAQAPQLPSDNFIEEPMGRNTAPAIGLAALHIAARSPQATMAVLTADHHIAQAERFRAVLAAGYKAAAEGHIVTLGIQPDHASTGFGYIEQEAAIGVIDDFEIHDVKAFIEKPDSATAEKFLESGQHSWNSGMFIWQVSRLMAEFESQQPAMYEVLQTIDKALGDAAYQSILEDLWPSIESISIDFALMESAPNVRVIPVDIGWNDVGSWAALLDVSTTDTNGNFATGEHLGLDTSNTMVISERLVATIGLEDIIIIDTQDAILVCKRERAQDVKKLVEHLKQTQQNNYL